MELILWTDTGVRMMQKIKNISTIIAIIGALYFCFDAYSTIRSNAEKINQVQKDLRQTTYMLVIALSGKPVEK